MSERLPGTVGIKRQPKTKFNRPRRRRRLRVWLLSLSIVVLALAALAGAALLGGAWYIEEKALEKLAELGDRAGLDVQAAGVVIEPGSQVEVFGLVVADPDDGTILLRADRVVTDLTFDDLRAGHRRPGEVTFVGLEVDATRPERWKEAVRRFRSKKSDEKPSAKRRPLPTVEFDGARIVVQDPLHPGQPLTLTGVAARFAPDLGTRDRWYVGATATLPDERQVEVTAYVDPKGQRHEAGISFSPPMTVALPDTPAVTLGGAYVRGLDFVRLRDVKLQVGPTRWASAQNVELAALGGNFPDAAARLTASGVEGHWKGERVLGHSVRLELAAASEPTRPRSTRELLAGVLKRVRHLTLDHVDARVPRLSLAVRVGQVGVSLEGLDLDKPMEGLSKVRLAQADVDWVLPTAEQAAGIPYYHQIQAFLSGTEAGTDQPGTALPSVGPPELGPQQGGGPSLPSVPAGGEALLTARPTITVEDGTLALKTPRSDEVAFLVEGLNASVEPGRGEKAVSARLQGKLRELATGESGSFLFEATTGSDGGLEKARIKLSGSKLARHVARFSDNIRLSDDSSLAVDLTVTPHAEGRGLTATGTVGLSNMGFEARRIHGTPVDGLEVEADVTVDFDPDAHTLTLDAPRIEIDRKARLRLAATVRNLDAPLPELDVKLQLPSQRCNDVLKSIPPVMVPRLKGLRLSGNMVAHLDFSVDLTKPRTYTHDLDVDLRACKVVEFGNADVRRLNRRFVHRVIEKGEDIGVTVGPATHHYRPLSRIPKYIQMGALHTEDHSFFRHSGFRPPLMRRAVIMNLEGGRYVYGGSTITQQLVKNLFLSREKTLTRKLEEAVIVWLMERYLTKQRILELYLNCIEYGPKIYGLQNAGRAYFGKDVEELDPLEGAFLMGLKPYPWAGWNQYERGWMKSWWHRRIKKIMVGMNKNGWLTDAQVELGRAYGWEPIFLTSKNRERPVLPGDTPEPDALDPNAVDPDAVAPDAVAPNAVDPDAPTAAPAGENGGAGRAPTGARPNVRNDDNAPPPTPNELPILIE